MKNLILKNCYLLSIIILLFSILFGLGVNSLIGSFCVSAILIFFMTRLKFDDTYFLKLENSIKVLIVGFPIIIVVLIANVINILQSQNFQWDLCPTPKAIIIFLLSMVRVGLFEEALMRGTIFIIMKESWKGQENGLIKAALISSLLFGFLHLLNLLENPSLIAQVSSQVIYAFFIGVYFCGLFIKYKNFIGLALLHSLIDLLGEGGTLFSSALADIAANDFSIMVALIQVVICFPLFLLGLHYLKEEKKRIKAEKNSQAC